MWCSGTTVPCMAKRSVALEVSSECGVVVELLLKGRDSMMALATLEMRELGRNSCAFAVLVMPFKLSVTWGAVPPEADSDSVTSVSIGVAELGGSSPPLVVLAVEPVLSSLILSTILSISTLKSCRIRFSSDLCVSYRDGYTRLTGAVLVEKPLVAN